MTIEQKSAQVKFDTDVKAALAQLAISDRYAAKENRSPLPSVWQAQNSLIRQYLTKGYAI